MKGRAPALKPTSYASEIAFGYFIPLLEIGSEDGGVK